MALFKILKGSKNNLGKTSTETGNSTDTSITKEGYAYFTPDDGKFYIDITSNETPKIGEMNADGVNRININSITKSEVETIKTQLESALSVANTLIANLDSAKEDKFDILNCGDASTT